MNCFSCQQNIETRAAGPTSCPHCGAINFAPVAAMPANQPVVSASSVIVRQMAEPEPQPHTHLKLVLSLAIILLIVCIFGGLVVAPHFMAHKTTNPAAKQLSKAPKVKKPSVSPTPKATPSPAANLPATPATTALKTSPKTTVPAIQPVATIPLPRTCTKGSYQAASANNTAAAGVGLQQTVDQPQQYTVYGYTAIQIRNELNQCTSIGGNGNEYDAETNWWLKTNYTWYQKPSGMCTVNSAGVIVHVTFIYPQWTNTSYAKNGLNSQWQTYMSNLTTHENGHRDLALQYANTMYNGFLNFPDTDCATIGQSLTDYGNNELAHLNQAEANYDTQTGHGATQGAVFP